MRADQPGRSGDERDSHLRPPSCQRRTRRLARHVPGRGGHRHHPLRPARRCSPRTTSARCRCTSTSATATSASPTCRTSTRSTSELRELDQLPTTSQPSIGDFLAVYEPLADAGRDIVSVHIAGGISGTPETARQAATEIAGALPGPPRRGRRLADRVRRHRRCARWPAPRPRSTGADVDAVARPRRRGRRRHEDLVRGRHAGVPQARRAHRHRAGVARRRAEDQADPHDRPRDHARRARPHRGPRLRADGRLPQGAPARTAPTAGSSSTSRPPSRPSASSSAAARSSAPSRSSSREIGPVIGTHVGPGLIGAGGLPRALMAELGV